MIKPVINTISDEFINQVCSRLAKNKRVRRSLPEWGRIHIDRQLPFICIYRYNEVDKYSLSDSLVTGEASYLTAKDTSVRHKQLLKLIKSIASTLKESFGTFLIVEVWVSNDKDLNNELNAYQGSFKINISKGTEILPTVQSLERSLRNIKLRKEKSEVEVITVPRIAPKELSPVISFSEARKLGIHIMGIEVKPIYFNVETEKVYPILLRNLRKGFSRALSNGFFEFTKNNTPFKPLNFQSLGKRSMGKAVWEVDRQLAEINKGFDFLLQVTPYNIDYAYSQFKRNHFEKVPLFLYRPLTLDPSLAKRSLFHIPIENIEDPTLAQLFLEQQLELDRKFSMLSDRGSSSFLYGSMQLYGTVDDSLMNVAKDILQQLSNRARDGFKSKKYNAKDFAKRAEIELNYFREKLPDIKTKISIRKDITGLMVSQGNLLIGERLKVPVERVEALIAHEVGTHVLTYLNGKSQPLKQLYIGLSGYDELQEGLAVLSEYLVGGLTVSRLRLLAARVVAAHHLVSGAGFIEIFRELNLDFGFELSTAFNITSRTFRSGGLTKDAIYLRGLVNLLLYIKRGESLKPLFAGKISADNVAMIKELQARNVLHTVPLLPAYFNFPATEEKLRKLRNGQTLINLTKRGEN
ncbi:MAG TPA: DUF1704 domain-containing protein [Ignavibacteria bacterium]|nr:DUF1704 domain-containing protein [Ignavibacteria bacterium]